MSSTWSWTVVFWSFFVAVFFVWFFFFGNSSYHQTIGRRLLLQAMVSKGSRTRAPLGPRSASNLIYDTRKVVFSYFNLQEMPQSPRLNSINYLLGSWLFLWTRYHFLPLCSTLICYTLPLCFGCRYLFHVQTIWSFQFLKLLVIFSHKNSCIF